MSHSPIELKGSNFTLSVVHLHDEQPDIIAQALQEKIKQAPAFLHYAPIVLNVSRLPAHADWRAIKQVVVNSGLRLVGVCSSQDPEQQSALLQAGFPLLKEGKSSTAAPVAPPAPTEQAFTKSKIINTPIRSGQLIYAKHCDLIVTNSVSAGAELVADGNIHIYGVMRGRALAGASGDTECQIFCSQLNAELVSIAGQYWLSDQIPREFYGRASRLCLRNNVLVIEQLS